MNIPFNHKQLATATLLLAATSLANAIAIDPNENATSLAETLIIPNSGVTITSSSLFHGLPLNDDFDDGFGGSQSGIYTNELGTYGLPGPGVVLSSGFVSNYATGPNTDSGFSGFAGTIASTEQNNLLTGITGITEHFDPVQLNISFDVDDSVENISFFATFGSDEWPEFTNSGVTDGFGLFLNGENVAGALPTGGIPGVDPLLPINIDHPDMTNIQGTELDGILAPNGQPVLRFDIPVEPGSTGNTFEIIVADAGDAAVDTTIYISSFGDFSSTSGGSEFTPVLPSDPESLESGFQFNLPPLESNEVIWIDPDVATGYTYTATDGGEFASVVAPSLLSVNDSDGYTITYTDASGNTVTVDLAPGESHAFSSPVIEFLLEGINTDLALDPTDPLAFVTGLSFANAGQFGVIQTPTTVFIPGPNDPATSVPEPGALSLLLMGLAGLVLRRRNKAS